MTAGEIAHLHVVQCRIDDRAARALLSARDLLVGVRGKIENEIRGLLKTFGVMFGKKVGGFARRAEEIVSGELAAAPEIKAIVETMMEARRSIIERIKVLDARVRAAAKQNAMAACS